MLENSDIDVVVFDVLGTMVDEPGGIRAAIRNAAPTADDASVTQMLSEWQGYVEREQRRIVDGTRPFVSTEVLDREAAGRVAEHANLLDPASIERLATAAQRL
jgi:2-haloacid dehalogenase